MFCKNCGRELSEGVEFCGNCGTKTTGALQTKNEFNQSKKEEKKEMSKALLATLGGLALLVVSGFILYHLFVKDLIQMGKGGVQWASEKIQENNQSTTSSSSSNSKQSQRSTTPQQSNTSRNTEILTYYVNGDKKNATVEYLGLEQLRYSYVEGRNIICESSFQEPGRNWTEWVQTDYIKNPNADAIDAILFLETNFYSAMEWSEDGEKFIFIYQKNNPEGINDEFQFIKEDRGYFYILAKTYKVH